MHYQKEIPTFFPNQPGYSPEREAKDRFAFDASKLNEHSPAPPKKGKNLAEKLDAENNPLLRELLKSAASSGSVGHPTQS